MKKYIIIIVVCVLLSATSSQAFINLNQSGSGGLFLFGGFLSYAEDSNAQPSLRIGGEASMLAFGWEGIVWGWAGLFTDISYLKSADKNIGMLSIGPEIGLYFFGIDGGLLLYTDGKIKHGATVRFHVSIPFLTEEPSSIFIPYYRMNYYSKNYYRHEFGMLFKFHGKGIK